MLRISALKTALGLAALSGVVATATAQNNVQFPQALSPSPTPSGTPFELPPLASPPPLPTPLPALPSSALPTPLPTSSPRLTPSPSPSPTPLPDGTMPLVVPAMPTPVLQDANTLSEQLNLPLPAPSQLSEPLGGSQTEAEKLKQSEDLAMQQKMVMADFEKSLNTLIGQQRNPKVANLTLNEAVQIALKQNPTILNSIQQIRLTRGQLIEVVAQAVPQIAISSNYQNQADSLQPSPRSSTSIEIPNPSGGKPIILTTGGGSAQQNQSWNIQFTASQLIFDGGATIAGIKAGSAAYDSAFFTLRSTVDNVVSQVITQFYQVVLNRALIVAQQQNVALLKQQVQDQQNRYEAGTVPRFNVLQAEVQLANALPPLIQAENSFRISLYQLVKLLGMDYPKGHPSEVPFNVVGALGYSPRRINTDESIRVAIARNPSLKAQRQNILVNASNVSAQIAGWFPTVNAQVGYEVQNDSTSSNIGDSLVGMFFGATGSWNVWDGGATYGRVSQAKAQLMQTKNTYDDGIRQVVLDVQTAISNLDQAKQTIDATTASVVQATEALRLARERLDAGAGTQLDVLNAQTQLLAAQTNVLQARYDYIAAMAQYDFALSLDTQYVETFEDPLVRPLNLQALNKTERATFQKVTQPDKPQPKLPKVFKGQDLIKPILESASPTPAPSKKKPRTGGLNK
jgi:TolC family type I secretion outer membrane protein